MQCKNSSTNFMQCKKFLKMIALILCNVNIPMKMMEILLEHYVNLFSREEKEKYIDEIWDMLQKAYAPIGGFKSALSKDALIDESNLWKIVRRKGKVVSVSIYKDAHGRKSIAVATDGTEQGKSDLLKVKIDDTNLKRAWCEASGKVESLMKKANAKPISSRYAAKLTGKEILGYDVDGIHYTRLISGVPHLKAIYGFPKLTKEMEDELKPHVELHKIAA